jgi:hypothetical protein
VSLRIGDYQRHILRGSKPEAATLTYNAGRKRFGLRLVLKSGKPIPPPTSDLAGVGITNLETASNGLRSSRSGAYGVACHAREELARIRERIGARHQQRLIQHCSAFAELQTFTEYRALDRGMRVLYADPR